VSSDRCAILRSELKQWEAQYVAANGGKKAGREEIKKDGVIGTYCQRKNGWEDIVSLGEGKLTLYHEQPPNTRNTTAFVQLFPLATPPLPLPFP